MSQAPRSNTMRVLIALFVAALVCVAAFALWLSEELILVLAVVAIVMWGFGALSDLLPQSNAARARMAKRRELRHRYPVYRYRSVFWLGLAILIAKLWLAQSGGYAWNDFWPALALMLVGLVAMLVWRFKYPELARDV